MVLSLSDGATLNKGIGNSPSETSRKELDFVIVQSDLDLDVCVGVHKKRKETGVIVVLWFHGSSTIKVFFF